MACFDHSISIFNSLLIVQSINEPTIGEDMNSWDIFVQSLSQDINWDVANDTQRGALTEALLNIWRAPSAIIERALHTVRDDDLFREYVPHFEYPRPVMDKFVLYMDPADRFRVRLHKFKSRSENRGIQPWIHDHRWCFASLILAGSYREDIYAIESEDAESRSAHLRLSASHILGPGTVNFGLPLLPHLTENEHSSVPCYSLFIRGKSFYPYSRIFDLKSDSFRPSWGLRRELEEEMNLLSHHVIRQRQKCAGQ